jgi:hypothetical protein
MKEKFGTEHYKKPTPVKWRKIGDACLLLSTLISGTSLITEHQYIAVTLMGVAGKFLTNFFSDEQAQ